MQWWLDHANQIECVDDVVSGGSQAYALHQADFHLHLLVSFKKTWDQPTIKAARVAVQVDVPLGETFIA